MNQGKVLQVGSPFEIYERPNSRFVADFIGDSNFVKGRVLAINGSYATVQLEESAVEVVGMCQGELRQGDAVTVSIRPEKVQISREQSRGGKAIPGRIVTTAYVGADTRLIVEAGEGARFMVWEPNRTAVVDSRQMSSPGQEVWLTLLPENTLILSDH
jgi:spermidine/putrescine transport system ATP-binding protein